MIDLRSDTLSTPTLEMFKAMTQAKLGDDGRLTSLGKGEDPTVNQLEQIAAEMTGKEDALFTNSGTMANIVALLTHTNRDETVVIDQNSHIYQSETSIFQERYFGRRAIFYETDNNGIPCIESLEKLVSNEDINLISLENSISYKGGTCISAEKIDEICKLAQKYSIPIHMDGARIFNVATYYRRPVEQFTSVVDSVQFCLSKGLCSPIGSLLCGSQTFIRQARKIRKLIGGGMRQAGVIAAPGLISLKEMPQKLFNDHQHAYLLAKRIKNNPNLIIDFDKVQTNIVLVDITPSGKTAEEIAEQLLINGLYVRPVSENKIRMMTYRNITIEDIELAAVIINRVLS